MITTTAQFGGEAVPAGDHREVVGNRVLMSIASRATAASRLKPVGV